MGVSLKPSDAVAGGAQIDDVDVTIKSCRFRLWDYNGTIPNPVLGLEVVFADDDGSEAAQVYSAGDTKHFVPSQDGSEAVQVGTHPALNDSTNAMAFMVSLVNAGFPEDRITDKCSVFEGTKVHVNQIPQPKRKGLKGQAATADSAQKNILLVSKILAFPWDAAAAKAPGKAAPKAAPKTATAGPVAVASQPVAAAAAAPKGNGEAALSPHNQKGIDTLLPIILSKGGLIAKAAIAQEAFKMLAQDPDRNAVVQLVYSDAFLGQPGVPWTFDGTSVSMA